MTEADSQRALLNHVVSNVFRRMFHTRSPVVKLFGSQKYGLAGPNSDVDFSLELPEQHLHWAKVVRAAVRQSLIDAEVTTWSNSSDQFANATLKWTDSENRLNVSLKVSPTSGFDSALAVTKYLDEFYNSRKDMKEPVMAVAHCLRDAKLMGGAVVGDKLKSAARSS